MSIDGLMIVAGEAIAGEGEPFQACGAESGGVLLPIYRTASPHQIESALDAADRASLAFGDSAPSARASLLEAIADAVLATGDELVERAMLETGLPRPRLEGERMRTANQLRLFAVALREGDFAKVRVDRPNPARAAGPKPELRLSMLALGPVAVFGASNFPLAFSVAGGDTASALAAGCPVIVKGHSAHPGTSEVIARAVADAVRDSGFPAGIFSMLQDGGINVGQLLAADTRIRAIGFTGSRQGGEALMRIAAARPKPIPVYAEMSSINPVLLFPSRLENAAEEIASAFVGSLTLGNGQFCTNPGLIVAIEGPALERFLTAANIKLADWPAGTMLTSAIYSAYSNSTATMEGHPQVDQIASGQEAEQRAVARIFSTGAAAFLSHPELHREMFGPAALVVRCRDIAEMQEVVSAIEGQLTIALHFNDEDHAEIARVLPLTLRKAGRVLANGFGTGVEVSPAMVHGGPYPATSDSRTTSVGTLAIERFLRPVCLQDMPEALLPHALRETNPWALPRRVW